MSDEDILTSINEPNATVRNAMRPFSINEPPNPDDIPPPEGELPPGSVPNPSLNSINPSSAAEDAGTITFNATGTRFIPSSQLTFGGDFIPTEFVNTGKLIGTVDVTHFGEGNYLVAVDNGTGGLSISKTFTVTAAGVITSEGLADPDELEDEIEAAEEEGDFVPTHGAKPRAKKRKR